MNRRTSRGGPVNTINNGMGIGHQILRTDVPRSTESPFEFVLSPPPKKAMQQQMQMPRQQPSKVHGNIAVYPMVPQKTNQGTTSNQYGAATRVAALAAKKSREAKLAVAARHGPTAIATRQPSLVRPPAAPISMGKKKPKPLKLQLDLQLNMDLVGEKRRSSQINANPNPINPTFETDSTNTTTDIRNQFALPIQDHKPFETNQTNTIDDIENTLAEVKDDGPADLAREIGRVKKLGKGAGGTVYLGCYVPRLKLVALKEVQMYHAEDIHMVQHELHALHANLVPLAEDGSLGIVGKLFNHSAHIGNVHPCPHMVSFYGAFSTPGKGSVSIAMEYMDGGSLQSFIDQGIAVSEPVLQHIAYCTMSALSHMRDYQMIHRDIKPANILVSRSGHFKIADFGLAATLSKSKSYFSEFQGTMMYMSPERITGKTYSYPSDVWAIGVVLFSLATAKFPFDVADGFFGLEEAIVNDTLPPLPMQFSSDCRTFVKGLLQKDPDARLTAAQALAHPFLRNYRGHVDAPAFRDDWAALCPPSGLSSEDLDALVRAVAQHQHMEGEAAAQQPPKSRGLFGGHASFSSSTRGSFNFSNKELEGLAQQCSIPTAELTSRLLSQAHAV